MPGSECFPRTSPPRWLCWLVLVAVTPGLAAVGVVRPVSRQPTAQAPASPAGAARAQGLGRALLGASGAGDVEPSRSASPRHDGVPRGR